MEITYMKKTAQTFLEKSWLEEIRGELYLRVPLAVIHTMIASKDQFTPLITSAHLVLCPLASGGLMLTLKSFSPDGSSGTLVFETGIGELNYSSKQSDAWETPGG